MDPQMDPQIINATMLNESTPTFTTQATDQPSEISDLGADYNSRNPDPYSDYSSRNPDPYSDPPPAYTFD